MLVRLIQVLYLFLFLAYSFFSALPIILPYRDKIECVVIEEEEVVVDTEKWYDMPSEPFGYRPLETEVPDDLWTAAERWGAEYEICPEFLCAIAWRESRWRNVVSDNGLYFGMMQIHPQSHKGRMERLGVTELMDVSQNVRVAADYLRELFDKYEDPAVVLAKYHGEKGDGSRISSYTRKILEFSEELERKHGK